MRDGVMPANKALRAYWVAVGRKLQCIRSD